MADDKPSSGGKTATSSQAPARDHLGPLASEVTLTADESETLEEIVHLLRRQPREPLGAAKQEAAKREILGIVSEHRLTARIRPPKHREGREQLEQVEVAAEKLIEAIEATENPPLFGLYEGKDAALRSARKTRNDVRRDLQSARRQMKDRRPKDVSDRDLIFRCFQIFDTYRPRKASTYEQGPFVIFVEAIHILATGKDKRFEWLIKDHFPSIRAWSQEVRDERGIGFFDNWQKGCAGATVSVYIAGTTTLASIFTDAALKIVADNPQTLDSLTDNGITYGSWEKKIYTDEKKVDLKFKDKLVSINKQLL